MGKITTARAWANNEVAFVAWDIDGRIDGCLGFEVTRVYLNADGSVERRADGSEIRAKCAAWVAFKGQSNPDWRAQDTGVWPVQKLSWRDLTVRKRRDRLSRRPDEAFVRYEIRPVGDLRPGLEAVPPNGHETVFATVRDAGGRPVLDANGKRRRVEVPAYSGAVRPLGYLAPAVTSNDVKVTSRRGAFRSTFTNGILAAQWLVRVLTEDGKVQRGRLLEKIGDPDDPHRKYLAGDVLPVLREFFARSGEFYLSLYELDDPELVALLLACKDRIHVILANSGEARGEWDARNAAARQALMDASVDLTHRMFNNATHIGHNKAVVHVPPGGAARSVLTGSTNWTSTGLAGQTNNLLLIADDGIAGAYLAYWHRLRADPLPVPNPLGAEMPANQPGPTLRAANTTADRVGLANGAAATVWFSPNRPERRPPRSASRPTPTPPDLADVYRRIRQAREALLFLAFYPSQRGADSFIAEAIAVGLKDPAVLVAGVVSSPMAMPNYVPGRKASAGKPAVPEVAPATFDQGQVSVVRAARIDDRTLLGDFGEEQLTAHNGIGAIVHDKILVIDPRLPTCSVVLGSHNLGVKASYCNDENLLIVDGDPDLAMAYAVHVIDVYDHYRFRAVEQELKRQGKEGWSGFLETNDRWQDAYVAGKKGGLGRYFAG